jgi:hypothetical protein
VLPADAERDVCADNDAEHEAQKGRQHAGEELLPPKHTARVLLGLQTAPATIVAHEAQKGRQHAGEELSPPKHTARVLLGLQTAPATVALYQHAARVKRHYSLLLALEHVVRHKNRSCNTTPPVA